jgi:hypothetical protein
VQAANIFFDHVVIEWSPLARPHVRANSFDTRTVVPFHANVDHHGVIGAWLHYDNFGSGPLGFLGLIVGHHAARRARTHLRLRAAACEHPNDPSAGEHASQAQRIVGD